MMQSDDVTTISCEEARTKMQNGAILLDVREYPEWLESHVHGARLIPLGNIKNDPQCAALGDEVLLLCRTDRRATEAAKCIAAAGVTKPIVITGGMTAWKAAGLPTLNAEGSPISLERQVRIGAGALVLLGLLIPKIRVIAYLVPCGLIFAGVTDWCGMAKVLTKMPWNRPRNGAKIQCCNHQTQDDSA